MVIRIVIYSVALVIILLIIIPYFYFSSQEKEPQKKAQINETNIVRDKLFLPSLFMPCKHYYLEGTPEKVAVGDVDNDGKNEVIILSKFGKEKESRLYIFTQSASGNLERPMHFYKLEGDIKSIAVGDINNDGKDEIITFDISSKTLNIFSIQPLGNIFLIERYEISEPGDVKVGDLNGDDLKDIVLIKDVTPNAFLSTLILQQKDGTLNIKDPVQNHTGFGPDESINEIVLGDMDSDGDVEFVLLHGNKERYKISMIDNFPFLKGKALLISNKSYIERIALAIDDIDLDGKNDIIVIYKRKIWLYLQDKSGKFPESQKDFGLDNQEISNFVVGDINGDLKKDIVAIDSRGELTILCRTQKDVKK